MAYSTAYPTIMTETAASGVAPSQPAGSMATTSTTALPPVIPARRERLRAGLMLLALLSLTVAFWVAVIGLVVKA